MLKTKVVYYLNLLLLMLFNSNFVKLSLGIIGLYLLFMLLSYYTEKIYSQPYRYYKIGKGGAWKYHHFEYPSLLAWTGCLLCAVYAEIFAKVTKERQNMIDLYSRKKLGLLFVLNILPSSYALLYVSYPLHVIAKASRYFFFILFGAFFSKNQQRKELKIAKSKIIIAVVIMLASSLFIYEESTSLKRIKYFKTQEKHIGILLLILAVVSDAFFVDFQAYCKCKFQPTANHLFQSYNFYAFLIIFTVSLLKGTLFASLKFVYCHPSVLKDIGVMCVLQLLNQQIAINLIIINFKQYIYPLISSTRRIVVLMFSIEMFQHQFSPMQWICVVLVCFGIGVELFNGIQSKNNQQSVKNIEMD